MALTRIDCSIYRSPQATSDSSSYVVLNPRSRPASVVMAVFEAGREGLGGQIACKKAINVFVDSVLGFFDHKIENQEELSVKVLEKAFSEVNRSVYEFGHTLSAGGRLAASMLCYVIEDNLIAGGRVGDGSIYLFRRGELFPFFGAIGAERREYIGTNSLVQVELSSIPIEASDLVVSFSSSISPAEELTLAQTLIDMSQKPEEFCLKLVRQVLGPEADLALAMTAKVGPEAIYLGRPI